MRASVSGSSGPYGDDALLVARGITKTYGTVQVLPPISFEISRGQALALTGPNGSGKTTALRIVTGETTPDAGAIAYRGETPRDAHIRMQREVVALFGAYPYYRDLTVREHLQLIEAAWPAGSVSGEVDSVLDAFLLDEVAAQVPGELSSGQAQLFALACACYRPAELVIIDEPEQNLDPMRRRAVGEYLAALKESGRALLLATHAPDLVERLADSVIRLGEDPSEQPG